MEPIHWLFVYLALTALCALIASKRGRSGGRYLVALLAAPVPLMLVASWSLAGASNKGFVVALVAFACPILGLILAIFSESGQQAAVSKGEYGEYKKCPFCAESVRREALKCKHCHSDLSSSERARPIAS